MNVGTVELSKSQSFEVGFRFLIFEKSDAEVVEWLVFHHDYNIPRLLHGL